MITKEVLISFCGIYLFKRALSLMSTITYCMAHSMYMHIKHNCVTEKSHSVTNVSSRDVMS